jgi:glycosyltransferase involved in cell wall biosynthesis
MEKTLRHQDAPRISAIIVSCNAERYLAEAIESILAQSQPASELIVVDSSTDGSAGVARRFAEVRYHFQPRCGIGPARNLGLELARGDFIAFLDADDLWTPEKLAHQSAAFAADPQLDIVTGLVEQFHSPELDPSIARTIHCPREPMPGQSFCAMLIRRAVFSRVGPVATDRDKAETVDWCLRARDLGVRVHMLQEIVTRRRLHGANCSIVNRHMYGDYAIALKASLDRRRATLRLGAGPTPGPQGSR